MFEIIRQNQFKRDIKLAKKQGRNLNLLKKTIEILFKDEDLPQKYKDHSLIRNYANTRECHI